MIDMEQLIADRDAGTEGAWVVNPQYETFISTQSNNADICEIDGWGAEYLNEQDANRRRIARLPDLEAAFIEAMQVLEELACYGDKGASERAEKTGSYGSFDEPSSVEVARAFLSKHNIKGSD